MGPGQQILLIVGSLFLTFVGIGATVPPLPLHVRRELGLGDTAAGLVLGVLWAAALAGRFLAGSLADRRGRRVTMLTGFGLCALAGLLYIPKHWTFMVLARAAHGLGEAYLLTAAAAWIVDLAGPFRRSQGLGYLSSGIWGGLSLGPVAGAYLTSFSWVGWSVFGAALAGGLMSSRMPADEPHPAQAARQGWPFRPTLLPGLMLGLANVASSTLMGFLPLHFDRHGWGKGGDAFAGYGVAVLCTRLFLGSLPDRLGSRTTLLGGLALMGLAFVALIFAPQRWVAVAATIAIGIGYSFPWPSVATIVISRVSDHERGSALGVLTAYYDLFVAVGSFLTGAIAAQLGVTAVFWFAVLNLTAGVMVTLATGLDRASRPLE